MSNTYVFQYTDTVTVIAGNEASAWAQFEDSLDYKYETAILVNTYKNLGGDDE